MQCHVDGSSLILVDNRHDGRLLVARTALTNPLTTPALVFDNSDDFDELPLDGYTVSNGHLYAFNWCNTLFDLPLVPGAKLTKKYSAPCDSEQDMTAIVADGGTNLYVASDAKQLFYRFSLPEMKLEETLAYPKPDDQPTTSVTALTYIDGALYWVSQDKALTYPFKTNDVRVYRLRLAAHETDELGRVQFYEHEDALAPLVLAPDASALYVQMSGPWLGKLSLRDESRFDWVGDGQLLGIDDAWAYVVGSDLYRLPH
jgi:hypothetical protein